MPPTSDPAPDDLTALRAALAAEQLARREAEARASGAEAMVAHLKLLIAKLRQRAVRRVLRARQQAAG
jgi:transposase